jgi:hypothetical protein
VEYLAGFEQVLHVWQVWPHGQQKLRSFYYFRLLCYGSQLKTVNAIFLQVLNNWLVQLQRVPNYLVPQRLPDLWQQPVPP